MIHFFGMVLKVSIDDWRVGGYTEYFYDEIFKDRAEDYSINVKGFASWAKDVITQHHFKQICSVFHPEPHFATNGEKCHKLCYALNKLNNRAKHKFIPGINLSFDGGR